MSLPKKKFCVVCLKNEDETGIKTCARCQVITYCSKSCQVANYPDHKNRCKDIQIFQKMENDGVDDLSGYLCYRADSEFLVENAFNNNLEPWSGDDASTKLYARMHRNEALLEIGLVHNHFKAMELAADGIKLFVDKTEADMKSELICYLVEADKFGEAKKLVEEEMEKYKDKGVYEGKLPPPKLLASVLAFSFVAVSKLREHDANLSSFLSVLDEAPKGSSSKRIQSNDLILERIRYWVFGPVYDMWERKEMELYLRDIAVLVRNKYLGVYLRMMSPKPINFKGLLTFFDSDLENAKYGWRIIRRLPWALHYMASLFLQKFLLPFE